MFSLSYIIAPKTDGANPCKIFESLKHLDADLLAAELRNMAYNKFLKTAYWFGVSAMARSDAAMRCQVCYSDDRINVHHRTYEHHGREHLFMNDLTVLCKKCHGLFHGHIASEPDTTVQPMKVMPPRRKQRRIRTGWVIPHTEAEVQTPPDEIITLTPALINACRANGAFTNATMRAFGLTRSTMYQGWPQRLVGTKISNQRYREALEGRFIYRAKPLDP
jgi:hypothetical protein